MLDALVAVLGTALLLLGLTLATVGLYGLLRKPDIFEQLHAAGLVTGPGVILVLLASLSTGHAETVTSALLVVAFVLVTSSLSTHAIALAAWRGREAATTQASTPSGVVGLDARPPREATPAGMRVLVALDGSPGADVALRLVAGLPWPDGSVVRLIGAVEGDLQPIAPNELLGEPARRAPVELQAAQDEAARLLERPGLTVDRVVRRGQPAAAIIDEARALDANLVVMGTRGLGRVRTLLVGSVAAGVVDGAPCPVLVARSTRLRAVLLATDGSEPSAAATEVVAQWPIFAGTRVHVLSVATAVAQDADGSPSTATRDAETTRQLHIAERAAHRLRDVGRAADAHVRNGDAAARIDAFAEAESIDLVVLGSRGRTGLRRTFLGSVARDVLSSAATSVLVVRAPSASGER